MIPLKTELNTQHFRTGSLFGLHPRDLLPNLAIGVYVRVVSFRDPEQPTGNVTHTLHEQNPQVVEPNW